MGREIQATIVNKWNWYLGALRGLGFRSLVRRQFQRLLGRFQQLNKLTSKTLANPVFARPGSSDYFVFDQIFVERQYRCLDQLKCSGLILDCGANVGYSSAYYLSKFPACFVIAVEPDFGNFSILKKNLKPYEGRYIAIQAAVWPSKENIRFEKSSLGAGKEWARSVEKMSSDAVASDRIETVDIPTLIRISPYDRVSILKVDIEGAERELFNRGSSEWLFLVDNIVIELHDENCFKVFFDAIGTARFDISTCGELTVCLSKPGLGIAPLDVEIGGQALPTLSR